MKADLVALVTIALCVAAVVVFVLLITTAAL
jgi:hypothetical protein